MMQDVTRSSEKQAVDIDQVKDAVSQIDLVSQKNAGLAHHTEGASDNLTAMGQALREVSERLSRMVSS